MIVVFNNGKANVQSVGCQYDGEKIPGDLNSWNILSSDSNDILTSTYGLLSKRSMTLYHTYGPARAAINKQTDYAIGSGLVFKSQPDWQSIPWLKRQKAKDWGNEFQRIVNYYMQNFNLYEKQSVLFRGALSSGDSLLFFVRENGKLVDAIEYGGDQIDWQYKTAQNTNKEYTLGIGHDRYLRKKSIRKADGTFVDFQDTNGDQNLIQFYIKEQPRQLRGYPLIYSIINLAKNDDRHHDAITQRAVMESIIMGSYETDVSDPTQQSKNMALANIKKKGGSSSDSLFSRIGNAFGLGAGNMYTMKKGEKINFTDLKTPSDNFGMFKEWMINYVATATGTPPEVILSKYSTSYTAHRGALNDFKKSFMSKRTTFSRTVMDTIIKEIAIDAILQGFITAPGFFDNPMIQRAYLQGSYLGPVPGSINPLQEVNASVKAVEEGFELRSSEASQRGNEFDNMLEQWTQEEQEFYSKSPLKQSEIIQSQETGGTI